MLAARAPAPQMLEGLEQLALLEELMILVLEQYHGATHHQTALVPTHHPIHLYGGRNVRYLIQSKVPQRSVHPRRLRHPPLQ